MKAPFHNFDPATHLKILMVAAVTVAAVIIVGNSAQLGQIASAAPTVGTVQPILHPTPQPIWREVPARSPLTPSAGRVIAAAKVA